MPIYALLFSAMSRRDLRKIETWIAKESSPAVAARYVDRLIDFCDTLRYAPHRGEERTHLEPGLRTIGYRNVSVIFSVSPTAKSVRIARLFYAGYTAAEENHE